jgi:membrane associated rhomboid family serine protease
MDDRPDLPPFDEAFEPAPRQKQPVFNLPTALVVTIALLCVIYPVQTYLLSADMQENFLVEFGFIPLRYVVPLAEQDFAWLWTPLTYSLLHGGIEHLLFNCLWLAAFGAPVLRRIGTVRFLLFWILSSAAAAFLHAALNWGDPTLLIGASGVIAALMGAACRFAFPPGRSYDRVHGHLYPLQSIAASLANRTVRIFAGLWVFGNLLVAVGIPLIGDGSEQVAWDAHIGGFLFGFLLFGFFDPLRGNRRPGED